MKIKSIKQLGTILGLPDRHLRRVLKNRQHYEKSGPKETKSGKVREIYRSWGHLRDIQRAIKKLLDCEAEHPNSHGCKGRSIHTNALLHEDNYVLLTVDIKNFFPSISVNDVFWLFLRLGCTKPVARFLARFVTYQNRLPQGAPTSQKLASLHSLALDRKLADFCKKRGLTLSRYVDDISISGRGAERIRAEVISMIRKAGFQVQEKKTSLAFSHQKQVVTGLKVNTKAGVGRQYRRTLRAICHACSMRGLSSVAQEHGLEKEQFIQSLRVKLAYASKGRPEWSRQMLTLAGVFPGLETEPTAK